jgi:hypothetical protein
MAGSSEARMRAVARCLLHRRECSCAVSGFEG